jgi:hypothetical protein
MTFEEEFGQARRIRKCRIVGWAIQLSSEQIRNHPREPRPYVLDALQPLVTVRERCC